MASRGLPAGKPAARLEVSVSHAGDRVAVAVCRGLAVGVDVEEVRADLDVDAIAPDVLAAEEVAWLAQLDQPDRRAAFVELWARKEAVLKGLGVGLEAPPRDLRVSGLGEAPVVRAWPVGTAPPTAVALRALETGPGYVGCLAVLGACHRVAEFDGAPVLTRAAELFAPGRSHAGRGRRELDISRTVR